MISHSFDVKIPRCLGKLIFRFLLQDLIEGFANRSMLKLIFWVKDSLLLMFFESKFSFIFCHQAAITGGTKKSLGWLY